MLFGKIADIDKPASRLIQGTLMIGGENSPGIELLDEIFEMGCTTFDTAHSYGRGENERTVGAWINSRGIRDKVFVIGKCCHPTIDRTRVTPCDITSDLYDSLARFKFEPIDLYLLHRDNPDVPVGLLLDTLNEHLEAGRIRAFGASNWSHRRLQEANEYAEAHGLVSFVASSPQFSLAEQFREAWPGCLSIGGSNNAEAREWYIQNQMPVMSWSSLAGGFFSGRFTRDNLDSFTDNFDKVCVATYCQEPNFQRLERAQQLADELGLTVAQVAMAFVLNQPMNMFAVVGCKTAEEFRANMQAMELRLDENTLDWLDLRQAVR